MNIMHEMNAEIKLHNPEEVQEFVDAASKCDFDIDVWYNRIVIDAKSILGVLSMDLKQAIHVRCFGQSNEFRKILDRFAVKA
jgi:phosphotransferase system HPr-like phosphotransfer protein